MGGEVIGHGETIERLEDAALERGGVLRLVESDAALAAHLQACPSCAAERDAWLRLDGSLVEAFGGEREPATGWDVLSDDLARRTLATVGDQGIPRGEGRPSLVAGTPAVGPAGGARAARGSRRRLRLLAVAAAVALLAGGATIVELAHQRDQAAFQRDQARQQAHQLADVTATLDALLQEPGHRLAPLAATATAAPRGTVIWGPRSGRLAVVTAALSVPPAGSEYRCWVERGGTRTPVGAMEFAGGLAYWAGWVDPAVGIGPGSVFGVSLVPVGGPSGTGNAPPPVLSASF